MEKIVKIKIVSTSDVHGTIIKEIHVKPEQVPQYKDLYDKAKFIWLTNHLNRNGIYEKFTMVSEGERMAGVKIEGVSINTLPDLDYGDASDY